MEFERRTFLTGALSAVSLATLAACTPRPTLPTPTVVPTAPGSLVPAPSAFLRSAWSTDPYSLGSFSMTPVGGDPGDRTILRETIGDRVFLAGEGTSSEFPGTIVGAVASGVAVAERVAAVARHDERIAVVGAGLAGATTARDLTAAGYDVVVIEARDRVGGRIDTQRPADWPFPVELGAASVSGEGLDELLRINDVGTISLPSSSEIRTAAGLVLPSSTVGPDAVAAAIEWAKAQPNDTSLASALAESGASALSTAPVEGISPADALTHYLDTAIASNYGATPFRLSARYGVDRAGTAEGAEGASLVVSGLDAVVQNSLDDIDVLLSAVVIRVAYDDDGVSLRLGTGESLSVDRVVLTVPIGVLQAGAIEFSPELPPATAQAVAALGMGTLEQLWLRFDEPFWSSDATVLSVLDETSQIAEWINLLPSTGQPILIGLTAADDVPVVATLGDDEFIQAALQTLVPFVDESLVATSGPTPTPTVHR